MHAQSQYLYYSVCCDELCCEMAAWYIRKVSAVNQSQHKAAQGGTEEHKMGAGDWRRGFTVKSIQSESQMRIYGHRATVNRRLLLALFVIISIFLFIDSTLSLVTKGKLFTFCLRPCHCALLFFLLLCVLCCSSLGLRSRMRCRSKCLENWCI